MFVSTVYVQIFKGCNFSGQSKSRIFMVLFSRIICYQPLSSICIVIVLKKFKDLIFVDDKLPAKAAKITSLENFYVYSMCKLNVYVYLCIYIRTYMDMSADNDISAAVF